MEPIYFKRIVSLQKTQKNKHPMLLHCSKTLVAFCTYDTDITVDNTIHVQFCQTPEAQRTATIKDFCIDDRKSQDYTVLAAGFHLALNGDWKNIVNDIGIEDAENSKPNFELAVKKYFPKMKTVWNSLFDEPNNLELELVPLFNRKNDLITKDNQYFISVNKDASNEDQIAFSSWQQSITIARPSNIDAEISIAQIIICILNDVLQKGSRALYIFDYAFFQQAYILYFDIMKIFQNFLSKILSNSVSEFPSRFNFHFVKVSGNISIELKADNTETLLQMVELFSDSKNRQFLFQIVKREKQMAMVLGKDKEKYICEILKSTNLKVDALELPTESTLSEFKERQANVFQSSKCAYQIPNIGDCEMFSCGDWQMQPDMRNCAMNRRACGPMLVYYNDMPYILMHRL